MAALDWTTTRNAVNAAIGATTEARQDVGAVILAKLDRLGPLYDQFYTQFSIDDLKLADELAHVKAVAAWHGPFQTSFGQADAAGRHYEGDEVTAQTGSVPNPYRGNAGGTAYPLSPSISVPFGIDETPSTKAAITLAGPSGGALKLEARDAGTFGNTITAAVANATSGQPGEFNLTLARGAYVELFENITPGTLDIGTSLLVGAATWLITERPNNVGATSLAGGTGQAYGAVKLRLERARQLASVDAAERAVIDAFLAELAERASKPTLTYSAPFGQPGGAFKGVSASGETFTTIKAMEDKLAEYVAEGNAWLAAV